MPARITGPDALKALRDQARSDIELRGGPKDIQLTVHMGTCGIAAGARDILSLLVVELGKENIHTVTLRQSGCAGLCDREPMLTLTDKSGKKYCYGKLDKDKVLEILRDHVVGGKPVVKYLVDA